MAYVAISRDVTARMKNKIKKMRTREIETECPNLDTQHTIDASELYLRGCWGAEHMHLVNVIPKDWLSQETSGTIRIKGAIKGEPDDIEVSTGVQFKGMTAAYRRPANDYWNRSHSELRIDELLALPSTTPGRAEAMMQYEQASNAALIGARWDKVEKQMMQVLDRCKSLNEAVKLFPGIKLYLDPSDIERMERKVSRAPREELLADLDLGEMTAAAVVANINGGV